MAYYMESEDFDSGLNPYLHPWRRYFAYSIDAAIYSGIYYFLFNALLKVPSTWYMDILAVIMGLVIYVLATAFLISRYKTTLGKWLWGFSIENKDGSNLTFSDSLARSFASIRWGLGFGIPIYNIVRLIISYKQSKRDERRWNESYKYELKDLNGSRIWAFIAMTIVLAIFHQNAIFMEHDILHKGDISRAEHIENVNRYIELNDVWFVSDKRYLDEDGKWARVKSADKYRHSLEEFPSDTKIDREFSYDENGNIIAYKFTFKASENDDMIHFSNKYLDEVKVLVLALDDMPYHYPKLKSFYKYKLNNIANLRSDEINFDKCIVEKTVDIGGSYIDLDYNGFIFIKDDEDKSGENHLEIKIEVKKK